ncbi:MAG: hypothetical protein NVS3B21_16970 [Acidimicrobiales bacterium]
MVRAAEGAKDSIIDRLNRPKFHDAAEVALGIVIKRIEALDEQVESGAKVHSRITTYIGSCGT